MRAFLALALDSTGIAFLRGYATALRAHAWARQVRWTAEATWHVTLRFLGEVTPAQIALLQADLAQRTLAISAPIVRITPPIFFPDPAHPRVVAARVMMNDALRALYQVCEQAAVRIGLPPERRGFRAHITLGRCKDGFPRHASLALPSAEVEINARALTLFQSDLKPSGPVYTELAVFALASPNRAE
jgi:2'-5' RNA ligase